MDKITIDLKEKAIPVYPELENLYVEPSDVEQVFTHENSYGYDVVRVARGGIEAPSVENETLIYKSNAKVEDGGLIL